MSLDKVRPADVLTGRVYNYKDHYDLSLLTQDIYKCQPHYNYLNYLHQPPKEPIELSKTKSFYPDVNRPRDLSLTTGDIDGAQATRQEPKSLRITDPVCPDYKFPTSVVARPITPPRYNGRVTNDVSDIEHCRPTKVIPDRNYIRDPNEISDIEYSCPNYVRRVHLPLNGLGTSTSLDVTDINQLDRTKPRCTNPLEPNYKVSQTTTTSLHHTFSEQEGGPDNLKAPRLQPAEIGPVPGSKPRKLEWDNGEPQFSLMREDIPGAAPQRWTGSVPYNIYDPPEKKQVISFHDPHDIPGAQVGSLRKGIETWRITNPLQPTYTFLDGKVVPTTVYRAQNALDAERGFPTAGPLKKSQSLVNMPTKKPHTPSERSLADSGSSIAGQSHGRSAGAPSGTCASNNGAPAGKEALGHLLPSQTQQTPQPQPGEMDTLPLKQLRYCPSSNGSIQQSMRSTRSHTCRSNSSAQRSLLTSRSCVSLTNHQKLDQYLSRSVRC